MFNKICKQWLLIVAIVTMVSPSITAVQDTGAIQGTVTFAADGEAVHGAVILLIGLGLVVLTDETGVFIIEDVPVGTYEVLAQRELLSAARETVTVEPGRTTTVNFALELSPIQEEVTVTATPDGQIATFEAFNATTVLNSFDTIVNPVGTLAEALENQPGIAKRSFGAGAGRPIIRGFDGDRVLVMEDGIRTGDLSSQSGDHGVNTDPNGLDRIEVVRGPATLLYGSSSVGGVVNAITPNESFKDAFITGTRGQVSLDTGSANNQLGTFANFQHTKDRLMVWASGGTRRARDYDTPVGTIKNSDMRIATGRVGVGYSGNQLFASSGFTVEDGRYGVPFAGEFHGGHDHDEELFVDIDSLRRVGRFDFGMRNLESRAIDSFQVVASMIDWQHRELEIDDGAETVGTIFNNRTYVVRADVNQRQAGPVSGRFGVWSQFRDYTARGEEALAPATQQLSVAAFAYEAVDLGRFQLQFGGRLERNGYTVAQRATHEEHDHEEEPPTVRNRDFTGGSASVGLRAELTSQNAFVANLTRSYRAPALEELYNFGPHVGNLVFEIGNPNLNAESTIGLDLSFRHQSKQFRGDINFYIYDIANFVFLDIQNELVDGLRLGRFLQGNGQFTGFDAKGSVHLGSKIWATLGIGVVNAELTTTSEALPRIPPLRGQLSIDVPYRGLTITPELNFAAKQDRVFRNETKTDGYLVFNLSASHVWPDQHMTHILSVSAYNLTNELYRNHTSFIKDLGPEIGRGVKVSYSLRFF
jgi:iron complex outermembrane receptor protein